MKYTNEYTNILNKKINMAGLTLIMLIIEIMFSPNDIRVFNDWSIISVVIILGLMYIFSGEEEEEINRLYNFAETLIILIMILIPIGILLKHIIYGAEIFINNFYDNALLLMFIGFLFVTAIRLVYANYEYNKRIKEY